MNLISGMFVFKPEERFSLEDIKKSEYYISKDIATPEEIEKEFGIRLKNMDMERENERKQYISLKKKIQEM